jgi:hypothetical protein
METKRKKKKRLEEEFSMDKWKLLEYELDMLSVKSQRLELKRLNRSEKFRKWIQKSEKNHVKLYVV